MAQEQGVLPLPGVTVQESLSDKPLPLRWLIGSGRFIRNKPLGAFGLLMIVAMIGYAASVIT